MRTIHLLTAVLMLCIGFFMTACSESIDEEYANNYGEIVKVHFDVAAESPAPHSRAANEGAYVADVQPWELIKQYRVAFANPTSGKIYAVVDKVLANIDVTVVFVPDTAHPSVTKTMKRRIYLTRKGII